MINSQSKQFCDVLWAWIKNNSLIANGLST